MPRVLRQPFVAKPWFNHRLADRGADFRQCSSRVFDRFDVWHNLAWLILIGRSRRCGLGLAVGGRDVACSRAGGVQRFAWHGLGVGRLMRSGPGDRCDAGAARPYKRQDDRNRAKRRSKTHAVLSAQSVHY